MSAVYTVFKPLGIYPSEEEVEQAAVAAMNENNADCYTVFPETADYPFYRRIMERLNLNP